MARGYLGKISAIVTVNTASVKPSLDSSSRDINAWAKSTQSRISGAANAAGRALEGIFTPLQKLQAAIKNANRNPLDLKIQNPGAYLQLAKATAEIAKPLGKIQAQFAGLSSSVQTELLPVLQAAQKQTTSLFSAISGGAKVSDRDLENTAARVQRLTAAIARANEAQSLAAGGRTGRELAFVSPRVQDELSRSAQLSNRAAETPVSLRSDQGFRRQIEELDQLRQRIVQYQSAVDRRQVLGLDTKEASARLDDTIRRSQALRSALEGRIDLDVSSSKARAEIDRLRVSLRDIREGVTFTVTGQVQNFDQARQELSRLQGQVAQLDGGKPAFSGRLQRLGELVATGDAAELEQVRRLIDDIGESLSQRKVLDLDASAANRAAEQLDRTLQSLREDADFVVTARPQNLEQVQSELQRILSQFAQLTEAQRGSLGGRVTAVIEAVGRQDLDAAIEALQQLRRDAGTTITVSVDTAAAENRIRRINESWDYAVRGVPSSIAQVDSEFQALASRIGGLDITARLDLDPLIRDFRDSVAAGDPLIAQFERLLALQGRLGEIEASARPAAGGLGPALDDPARQIDQLRSGIVGVKGQLDSLPLPIRTQFLPAIEAAQREFDRLRALGPAATAEEIENATNNMRTLTAAAQRAQTAFNFNGSFGGANAQGLDLSMQARSLQGYQAQLQTLQQVLGRVSSEARGPAYASFIRLQQAISTAFQNGTLDATATRAEIARLTTAAVNAASAVSGVSARSLGRDLQRAGDVGRAGFDRFSLAANQAAFAIDDFFSSTGGLEFKLRAVSNNITQLAFILGGTTGLFIGLGAVLTATAAVGLVKWINNGRTAEDSTKALNDALARQKSLVEELAQAFSSLGDSITRSVFSEPAQQARAFQKELDDVRKKQKEVRESGIADLDRDVQRERAQQNERQRALDSETDPGRRVAIQRQIEQSRRREQEAARAAVDRRVGADEAQQAVRRAAAQVAADTVGENLPRGEGARRVNEAANAAAERAGTGTDPAALLRQRAEIQRQIDELTPIAQRPNVGFFGPSLAQQRNRDALRDLEQTAQRLDNVLVGAIDELSNSIKESSRSAAQTIEAAQTDVADAIARGVPGAAAFQAALDNTASQLKAAFDALDEAQKIKDPTARGEAVSAAQGTINDIRLRQDAINERSREIRLGRTIGGERTTSALSALQGNERFANEYAGLIARVAAAVDAETAARQQLAAASGDAAKREAEAALEAAQAAGDLAAATAEAALAMEQALTRLRKVGSDALSASEGLADDAQRRLTQDPTVGLDAGRRERDAAERQLINDRERVAKSQAAIDRARTEAGNDPAIARISGELEGIRSQREALAEDARINGTQADPRRMEELARREAELIAERERRLLALTEAERRQIDAIAYEIDARRRLADQIEKERQFDQEVANRRNPVGDPSRGLDLGESPAARAGRETAQGLADINAAYDEQLRAILDRTNGLPNDATRRDAAKVEEDRRAAEKQFMEDQMRQLAPLTVGMADARQNALLQGPSRAALGATDVTTMQGQAELNRLLRGDDPNKNVDLVELQREANKLLEAIAKKENQVL